MDADSDAKPPTAAGAREDWRIGEDFARAQSLLQARVGAYGDSLERNVLAALARFGKLHRLVRRPPGTGDDVPGLFRHALEAFVVACRLAAFDRSVRARDTQEADRGEAAGPRVPADAEAEVRSIGAALGSLERELLTRAEHQEWSDANLNAAQYRGAARFVARSRALLQRWLAAP